MHAVSHPGQARCFPIERPVAADVPAERLTDRLQHLRDRNLHGVGDREDHGHGVLQFRPLLGPPSIGHFLDHGTDTQRLAVCGEHRVVAREPEALCLRVARRAGGHLECRHRLPGLEYAPRNRLQNRGEMRNDLREGAAAVLLRRKLVDHGQGLVHADVAQVAIPEAEADRRTVVERVEQRRSPLRLTVERSILERGRCLRCDVLAEHQVVGGEAAAGWSRHEADGCDDPFADADRNTHVGREADRPERAQMIVVLGDGDEQIVVDLPGELRLARQDDARRARIAGLIRPAPGHLVEQRHPLAVAVLARDAHEASVLLQHVDEAPVGDPRDGSRRDIAQRRLEIDRGTENLPDLDGEAPAAREQVLARHLTEIGDRVDQSPWASLIGTAVTRETRSRRSEPRRNRTSVGSGSSPASAR